MTKPTGRPRGRPRKHPRPEDDDLIGAPPAPKAAVKSSPRPRPDKPSPADAAEPVSMDLAEVYGGVTAHWLAQVFGADKNTIKKKLASSGIEIVGRSRGSPLYRIPDAAPYLVKPKVDLVSYVKGLRPNDLPPILNDAYWAAMLKRQKWEENARDLWRTEDVLNVLGDTAFMIRSTTQLWVEDLDRLHGLSPDMRLTVTQQVDKLLEQIHEAMIEAPRKGRTLPSSAEEGAVPGDDRPRTEYVDGDV